VAVHVPESAVAEAETIMREELTRQLWWLPNIPLAVDIRVSEDYSK
jgi:hypothetical protein